MIKPVKLIPKFGPSYYVSREFSFSIVTPINGTQYVELTSPHTCREVVSQSFMKACANNGKIYHEEMYDNGKMPLYKTDKIRIAAYIPKVKDSIYIRDTYKRKKNIEMAITERAFIAKRILNMLEKFADFGKTNVVKAIKGVNERSAMDSEIWVFNGPKGWLFSSQLMSLYMLIIRISFCVRKKYIDKIDYSKDIDAFIKSMNYVIAAMNKEISDRKTRQPYYEKDMTNHMKKIINDNMLKIILNNRRKLFNGIDRFPYEQRVAGGITSMCTYASHSKKLDDSFKNMVNKEKDK